MALSVNLSASAANGGAPLTYSAGTTYAIGDVVTSGGVKFKCKAISTGNTPATGANTYWVEIVEKTIGNATRDYQTIAAWLAACPSLTTTNQIWKGLIYKEGNGATEWTGGDFFNPYINLNNKNTITGPDNFIWLEPAAGQGFLDNANVRTNALVYSTSTGVAISSSNAVYGGDRCGYSFLRGLQLKGAFANSNSSTLLNISQCIVEWQATSASFMGPEWGTLRAVNSAFRSGLTSNTLMVSYNTGLEFTNCTFLGAGGTSSVLASGTSGIVIKNCAFIGFSAIATTPSTQIVAASSTYNATDLSSFGYTGTGNVVNLTAANQLQSIVSPFDMRVKTGAGLINAAIRVQAETNDLDISLFARSLTTPTVGAWEYAGVTPPPSTTDYSSPMSRGIFRGIERGVA